ncbi:predicted protein [Chaetoceros tenuissimus]|uniref:Uncharacterized protein n=1 Tax=Chaetoceros tenuissimus TaxID=426638 RepID=A0AAD3CVM5_9STRA|nr:predicted protein [Chaetoceros tenuissimus]
MDLISKSSTQEKAAVQSSTNGSTRNPLRPTDQTPISTKSTLSTSEEEKGQIDSIRSTATPSTNDLDSPSRKKFIVHPQGGTNSSSDHLGTNEGHVRKTTYTAEEGRKSKNLLQETEVTSRKVSSQEQVQHTNTTNKVGTGDKFKEKKCLEKEPSRTVSSSEQRPGQPQSSTSDLVREYDQGKVQEDCTKTPGVEKEEKPSSSSQSTHTTLSVFDNPTQSASSQTQSKVFIPSFGARTNETATHIDSNKQTQNFMFPPNPTTGLPMKRSFDQTVEKPISIIEQTLEEFKKPRKAKSNNELKRHDIRMRKLLQKAISSDALKKKHKANEQNCQSDPKIFLI